MRFRGTLVAASVLLLVWVVCVYAMGFVGVSNDDASRALIAWDFSRAPSVDPTRSSWLPVHTYLLGGALRLFPWLDVTPRVISWASGVVAGILAGRIAQRAGVRAFAVGVALALVVSWRWTVMTSAACAVPEMTCVALVMAAVSALGGGDRTMMRRVGAGVLLALACGHRYEAWCAAAAVGAVELYTAKHKREALALAVVAVAVPALWLWINHARAGDAFDFARRVVAARHAEGPLASWPERLWHYPLLFVKELPAWWLLAPVGARRLWTTSRAVVLRCGGVALAVMAFLVYGELRGGGPTHHHARTLLLVAWPLVPLVAAGVEAVVEGAARRVRRAVVIACVAAVGVMSIAWSRPRAEDWRGGVPADAVAAGDRVARILATEGADTRWLVELERLDFLWVELRSGAPERAVPDRVFGRPAPGTAELGARARGASVAAVSTPEVESVLRQAGFVEAGRYGGWVVLRARR